MRAPTCTDCGAVMVASWANVPRSHRVCPSCRQIRATYPAAPTEGRPVDTTLYRFYDAAGDLLYVGITSHGAQRWAQHSRHKSWWRDVASAYVDHYPTREAAAAAELSAIRDEMPRYNVAGAV